MKKIDKKIAQVGWKQLVKSYRRSVGDADSYAPYDRLEIFQRFLSSGTEEKGSYSYLFAESGKAVGLVPSVDIGKLFFPFLTLKFSFGGNYQNRKVFLPMVHRTFARRLTGFNHLDRSKWTTDKPVSLMLFTGKYHILTAKSSATVGVGTPKGFGTGLDTIDFGLWAGASIGGDFSGHFFSTQDDAPANYTSATSKAFLTDFDTLFGDDQFLIVDDFFAWYDKNFKDFIKPVLGQDRKASFKARALKKLPQIQWVRKKQEKTKADVEAIIKSILTKISEHKGAESPFKDSPLIDQLKEFQQRFTDAESQREPIRQVDATQSNPGLCFLDVLSLSPLGKADIEGRAKMNLKILKIKVSPSVSAKGELKAVTKTSYSRFQNYARSRRQQQLMVFTQDTVVSFTQIMLEGKASLKVSLKVINKGKEKKIGKTFLNKMSYYAASSFWIPDRSGKRKKKLQIGSGVSFGITVRFGALFEIAKSLFLKNNDQDEVLKVFANRLKVAESNFREFVSALFSSDDLKQESSQVYPELMGEQASIEWVLLESAFIYTNSPTIDPVNTSTRISISDPVQTKYFKEILNEKTGKVKLKNLGLQLESIRVRIRIADHLDNPEKEKIFHLGAIKGTGPNFTLDTIRDSGNEGVFSMFTYFFENNLFPDVAGSRLEVEREDAAGIQRNTHDRREWTVPPVFIPPHTLANDSP